MSEIDKFFETDFDVFSNIKYNNNIYFNIENSYMIDNFVKILLKLSKDIKYNSLILPENLFNSKLINKSKYINLNYYYLALIILLNNNKYKESMELINLKLCENNLNKKSEEYLKLLLKMIITKIVIFLKKIIYLKMLINY